MEKTKIQVILDWPKLKNTKEVQQFIRLINYYCKFLKGYSIIMGPLFKLLKKDCKFEWRQEQQEAFKKVKEAVTEEPVLAQFNAEKEMTIETDASDYTIGMSMTQPGPDEKPRPVAFHSWKLVQAKLNYNIHNKELLAIMIAFKTWRVYLEGAKHIILMKMDHKNLTFFMTTKELMWKQARWAEVLS